MAAEATKKAAPKRFTPDWDKIMDVLGRPNQEAVMMNRNPDPESMDGSWDHQAMQRGLGMRRIAADVGKSNTEVETPSGFVFFCQCGYARRVIDSEHSFTCERPNQAGAAGCGVIWEKEIRESETQINPKNGEPMKEAVLEEKIAPRTNRKYMMPKITGRYIAEMQRETWAARKAAGQPISYQPQEWNEGKPERFKQTASVIPAVPPPPTPSQGAK